MIQNIPSQDEATEHDSHHEAVVKDDTIAKPGNFFIKTTRMIPPLKSYIITSIYTTISMSVSVKRKSVDQKSGEEKVLKKRRISCATDEYVQEIVIKER